ncbi:hypothetical protein MPER_11168 [Moniliophthora perniciosa FA553]|nr:hypothetical protein MPER_11168 [Moniliophthora perniciosa FA553]
MAYAPCCAITLTGTPDENIIHPSPTNSESQMLHDDFQAAIIKAVQETLRTEMPMLLSAHHQEVQSIINDSQAQIEAKLDAVEARLDAVGAKVRDLFSEVKEENSQG